MKYYKLRDNPFTYFCIHLGESTPAFSCKLINQTQYPVNFNKDYRI
jgi:hypothetical protein